MGSILAALVAIRNWGSNAPHLRTHFDCTCSNDTSSSSSEEAERDLRKTTTWLERHRPTTLDAKKIGAATTSHTAPHAPKDKHGQKTYAAEK